MPHLKILVAIKVLILLQILQTGICLGRVPDSHSLLEAEGGGRGGPPSRPTDTRYQINPKSLLNSRYPGLLTPLSYFHISGYKERCSLTKYGQLCLFYRKNREYYAHDILLANHAEKTRSVQIAVFAVKRKLPFYYSFYSIITKVISIHARAYDRCLVNAAFTETTESSTGVYIVALPDLVQSFHIGQCGSTGDCRGNGKKCMIESRQHQFLVTDYPVQTPGQLAWAVFFNRVHFEQVPIETYCKCVITS
ncbi:hypothetical protein CAPTEDRAFT_213524 [Capitella teleta]|uniref:Spaetzle domain-containing protein n=1 Tax=Capitella teleta TaxID=283909 RepID=R7V681_CAPTE|nr:hypothetical protein CAPTEDRAFT_213524 [Capitella teleta]|eukprot:ELU14084.1 hypothetical protein CAPTEDRAFT_213524 [Capitella teleta]